MFRCRNEELKHLIECHRQNSDTTVETEGPEDEIRSKLESFCTVVITNTMEDNDLDLQFANTVYEFDRQLFLNIFKTAVATLYSGIGFNDIFRMIGEVKYFSQAIAGYSTIFDKIKNDLPNNHEYSFYLREKLQQMTKMKDFERVNEEEKSSIENMIQILEPFSMLPKPIKSKRVGNWAEHFLILAGLENYWAEEENKFYSLFQTQE